MRQPLISRRALVAGSLLAATAARADTEVTFVATPAAPDCTVAVALDEGFLSRAGIAAKFILLPLAPSIPAAVVSNSAQVGFITTPTFLQAVDGGIDLVAICGAQVTNNKVDDGAVLSRPDVTIAKPTDFIGKTVGIPGIGAFFHVIFRYWLIERGVDPAKVNYLEVPFPGMADALRGKSVDAVLAIEPFYSAIVASGAGQVAFRLMTEIPSDKQEVMFVTTRAWATGHRQDVIAIRGALGNAEAAINKDRDLAIRDLIKYVKLPPAVLPHVSLGTYQPKLDVADFEWWVGVMTRQGMLNSKLNVASLVWS